MTNPLATADFFALEAGECLDRLELLARRDDAPPAEDFLRASRVLRGRRSGVHHLWPLPRPSRLRITNGCARH